MKFYIRILRIPSRNLLIYCLFHNATFMLRKLLQIVSELGNERDAAGHRLCKNFDVIHTSVLEFQTIF